MNYLKEKRFEILFYLLCLIIFNSLYFLYGQEMEIYLYPTVLSAALGLIFLTVGYISRSRRHKRLLELLSNPEINLQELPDFLSLTEKDYQQILVLLQNRLRTLETRYGNDRQESMDFYSTWVHQIKTPIAVMQMFLKSEDTEQSRELQAELFRIEQYVDLVLTYSRLNSDSSDFVFQNCSLDSVLRQCIRKFAPQFIRKKIRLDYEPTSAEVLSDEKWLSFIVEQLLSNAVKYTYQGCVSISVTPDLCLTIKDSGIGIAPEDLPRIFEKGFTGYNGRAHKKSTGLGLYLVNRTAHKLGISIRVESTPGKGTAFYLDLARRELEVE